MARGYTKKAGWIPGHFAKQDVFITGGGPSLEGFDFKRLESKNTICINHAYRYCKTDINLFPEKK